MGFYEDALESGSEFVPIWLNTDPVWREILK